MNGDELGRSITQAVRFLRKIYQDVAQLLTALDGLMAEKQWQPTERNKTSDCLSNGMEPSKWVLEYQFRWYVPAGPPANFQDLIAFAIRYDPPSIFDGPVVLGTAAHFPAATNYPAVSAQWTDLDPVVAALGAKPGPRSLSAQEVSSYLPSASRVTGLVVPLCQLTGTDTLLSCCIDPLLGWEKTERRQKGEANLRQAHREALNRSGGKQTAATTLVSELCQRSDIPPEVAEEICKEARKQWQGLQRGASGAPAGGHDPQ
jgi:hypothetical protein